MGNDGGSYVALQITQIESGLYAWSVQAPGVDPLALGYESSVADCLSVGADAIEPDALVAVAYRGITLGTFRRAWLVADPAGIADDLMQKFAELLG